MVVYTKNNCMACRATKKLLKTQNIQYVEINIDTDSIARQELVNDGWKTMPVIKTKETSWSGFQPDRIRNLKYNN